MSSVEGKRERKPSLKAREAAEGSMDNANSEDEASFNDGSSEDKEQALLDGLSEDDVSADDGSADDGSADDGHENDEDKKKKKKKEKKKKPGMRGDGWRWQTRGVALRPNQTAWEDNSAQRGEGNHTSGAHNRKGAKPAPTISAARKKAARAQCSASFVPISIADIPWKKASSRSGMTYDIIKKQIDKLEEQQLPGFKSMREGLLNIFVEAQQHKIVIDDDDIDKIVALSINRPRASGAETFNAAAIGNNEFADLLEKHNFGNIYTCLHNQRKNFASGGDVLRAGNLVALAEGLVQPQGACLYGMHAQSTFFYGLKPPQGHPVYLVIDEEVKLQYNRSLPFFDLICDPDPRRKGNQHVTGDLKAHRLLDHYQTTAGILHLYFSAGEHRETIKFTSIEYPSRTIPPTEGSLNAILLEKVKKYRPMVENPLHSVAQWFTYQSSVHPNRVKGVLVAPALSYEIVIGGDVVAYRKEDLPKLFANDERLTGAYAPIRFPS